MVAKRLAFSLAKGVKERGVPLPSSLALRASAHIAANPPVEVTLPWKTPDGPPHTARLLVARSSGRPHQGSGSNYMWHAVRKTIGVPETPENGMHVLRHTAPSAWLAMGVDIRTVAEYLGHADPGFTLRTYAHLMPNAADRAPGHGSVLRPGGQDRKRKGPECAPHSHDRDRKRRSPRSAQARTSDSMAPASADRRSGSSPSARWGSGARWPVVPGGSPVRVADGLLTCFACTAYLARVSFKREGAPC
ncbi:tyrosine-type recombinase/integrase [Actinomadura sp. NPDC048955]|uniref:tyrosine-type recombinase/integrase n=1 Tax=Actinomadura sp. NPDC048955 TaxID=3158228 RepID=UPI00340A69EE